MRCTYLLPIRRTGVDPAEIGALTAYFQMLARAGCDVLVVDGSPPAIFAAHRDAWKDVATHAAVDPRYRYLNGKVNGIHTGVDIAKYEHLILADDDIRYTATDVDRMCALLDRYDMVRPQNYLSPLPWWGRIEAARMLVNRGALRTGDYPGTCGVTRSAMLRVGHYDGDVLFDNEELVRHFIVKGARVCHANDFFILKRAPTFAKWREQRPRQAYEDFVMRVKTLAFMAVLPLGLAIAVTWGPEGLLPYTLAIAAASMTLADRGRRGEGARYFPAYIPLFAPVWVLERSMSVYAALFWRVSRGGYPFGNKLLSKGTGSAWIEGGRGRVQPHEP